MLPLREAEFVTATPVLGVDNRGMVFGRLLSNIVGPHAVVSTFGVASAILLEALPSFLGLGDRAPNPSLGILTNGARAPRVLHDVMWLWLPAGILIALTVLTVNFVGD